jgi:hypothetical protein
VWWDRSLSMYGLKFVSGGGSSCKRIRGILCHLNLKMCSSCRMLQPYRRQRHRHEWMSRQARFCQILVMTAVRSSCFWSLPGRCVHPGGPVERSLQQATATFIIPTALQDVESKTVVHSRPLNIPSSLAPHSPSLNSALLPMPPFTGPPRNKMYPFTATATTGQRLGWCMRVGELVVCSIGSVDLGNRLEPDCHYLRAQLSNVPTSFTRAKKRHGDREPWCQGAKASVASSATTMCFTAKLVCVSIQRIFTTCDSSRPRLDFPGMMMQTSQAHAM